MHDFRLVSMKSECWFKVPLVTDLAFMWHAGVKRLQRLGMIPQVPGMSALDMNAAEDLVVANTRELVPGMVPLHLLPEHDHVCRTNLSHPFCGTAKPPTFTSQHDSCYRVLGICLYAFCL